jgi:hypothetical protein
VSDQPEPISFDDVLIALTREGAYDQVRLLHYVADHLVTETTIVSLPYTRDWIRVQLRDLADLLEERPLPSDRYIHKSWDNTIGDFRDH